MRRKAQVFLGLPLLMVASFSWADRSAFYTIVGPDGHIIVIDRRAAESSAPTQKRSEPSHPQPVNNQLRAQQENVNASNKVEITPQVEVVKPKITEDVRSTVQPVVVVKSALPTKSEVVIKPEPEVVKPPNPDLKPKPHKVEVKTSTVASLKAPTKVVPSVAVAPKAATNTVVVSKDKDVETATAQTDANNPVDIIDGEKYIESEYLEQKEFNLDGKKRFYSVPDGLGGTQVIQREKGLDMNVFRGPKIQVPKVVTLSKNYQRMPAQQVSSLTGTQCFSEKQLEKTKPLKDNATTDFWPRPSFEPKFDFVVAKFEQQISDIEFTSYANSIKNPKFYWPLPVFLDTQGCVLEGVNAFYLRTLSPTISQHQAIQGYLHVPNGAKYLLLTPLEAAADLDQIQLTNQGQVRLTPIR